MGFNFENPSNVKPKSEERLNEKEALAYQSYATEKDGLGFSEVASEESYKEADALLQKLSLSGVELDGIDLGKIDLRDSVAVDNLCNHLEKEVRAIGNAKKDEGILKKIAEAVGGVGMKKVIVLLGLFSALSAEMAHGSQVGFGKVNLRKDNAISSQSYNNGVRGYQNIKMGSTNISFGYDKFGNPVEYNSQSARMYDRQTNEKMRVAIENMLDANVDDILKSAPLSGCGTRNTFIVKKNLELVCMRLLENAGVYMQLKQMGKNTEANFLRSTMSNTIVQQENLIGANVFNTQFIRSILDAAQ